MDADVESSGDLVDGVTEREKGSYPGFRRRQLEGVDQELGCQGALLTLARDVGDGANAAESADPKRRSAGERLATHGSPTAGRCVFEILLERSVDLLAPRPKFAVFVDEPTLSV